MPRPLGTQREWLDCANPPVERDICRLCKAECERVAGRVVLFCRDFVEMK